MRHYSNPYKSQFDLDELNIEEVKLDFSFNFKKTIHNIKQFTHHKSDGSLFKINAFDLNHVVSNSTIDSMIFKWMIENKFHSPAHILSMFNFYDVLIDAPKMSEATELAIWFHDAICIPGSLTNEEDSCKVLDWANDSYSVIDLDNHVFKPILPAYLVLAAKDIIMATSRHLIDELVPHEVGLMLDLDVYYYGINYSIFKKANDLIRQEYSNYSDTEWKSGRETFMNKMLKKKTVFRTEYFIDRFEKIAKENIRTILREGV